MVDKNKRNVEGLPVEHFVRAPPDPFKFDFQTAELVLKRLSAAFELVGVTTVEDFIVQMKAKYNAGVLDAAASGRKNTEARLRRELAALDFPGFMQFKCTDEEQAASFAQADFPDGVILPREPVRKRYHGVEGRLLLDERAEPLGPAPSPVPIVADGAVGGSDPTPTENQGQGPEARPDDAALREIREMCQSLYLSLTSLGVTIGAIEQRAYELDREHA